MKKILAAVALLLGVTTICLAQKPDIFETREACESHYKTGNYSFYVARNIAGWKKNAVNGRDSILARLESDAVVEMITIHGKGFTILPQGTQLRWVKTEMKAYAMDTCGNTIFSCYPLIGTEEKKPVASEPIAPMTTILSPISTGNITPSAVAIATSTSNDSSSSFLSKNWWWIGAAAVGGGIIYYETNKGNTTPVTPIIRLSSGGTGTPSRTRQRTIIFQAVFSIP
jgi:hypothetical protein